ncbi:MAG: bifunctional aminoglycoside phosphotransferase/ATP-binding protein [Solirubrobacteraceae bacterium]
MEVRETHISWVFLAGDRAYKLKKPIVLEFVDYGTAARRRRMCEAEVALNRRLAPDVYLGVRGVALASGHARLTDPEDPEAVDHVVEMRRFDERGTLAAALERGELRSEQVRAVGAALAAFHARVAPVAPRAASTLAVERRFERNVHELLECVGESGEIGRVLALRRFAHACIVARAEVFEDRASREFVRDGHGDLRAEHVLIGPPVQVVDCVEFDPGLRALDVADDLAFLVFDLTAHGGERFAAELLHSYRAAGGDPGEDWLVSFYAAYRALVRAKVALVRASQLPPGGAEHGAASAHARDLIAVAERFAWRARLPLILVVCGVPASGKSVLASELAEMSGLPHLSSDVTRKQLAGLDPSERAPRSAYSADASMRTYRELGRRAGSALHAGGGAVIDATFRRRADRRAFAAELADDAPVLFVECWAPDEVLAARAQQREREPDRISDADAEVVLRERANWEPLSEVAAGAHILLRSDRPVHEMVSDVLALMDRRLESRVRRDETVVPRSRSAESGSGDRGEQRVGFPS